MFRPLCKLMYYLHRLQDAVSSLCVHVTEVTLHILDLHIAFVFSLDVEIWRDGQGLEGFTCTSMNLHY